MSETSETTTDAEGTFHWGTEVIDTRARDLPGLKAAFLIEHAPERGKVLEVGCGGGKMLRTLAKNRPELSLFGCDVREPQVPPDAFEFRRIDAETGRLPYDDGAMDAVLFMDVLEHVPRPHQTISEAERILAPGGKLIAFVPVEGERLSFYALARGVFGDDTFEKTKEHIQAFTHEGLRAMIAERFEIVRWRYAYHLLGHAMDATLFTMLLHPAMREKFWSQNKYYNATTAKPSLASRAMNAVLSTGNALAWAESRALSKVRATSAGVLFVAKKR